MNYQETHKSIQQKRDQLRRKIREDQMKKIFQQKRSQHQRKSMGPLSQIQPELFISCQTLTPASVQKLYRFCTSTTHNFQPVNPELLEKIVDYLSRNEDNVESMKLWWVLVEHCKYRKMNKKGVEQILTLIEDLLIESEEEESQTHFVKCHLGAIALCLGNLCCGPIEMGLLKKIDGISLILRMYQLMKDDNAEDVSFFISNYVAQENGIESLALYQLLCIQIQEYLDEKLNYKFGEVNNTFLSQMLQTIIQIISISHRMQKSPPLTQMYPEKVKNLMSYLNNLLQSSQRDFLLSFIILRFYSRLLSLYPSSQTNPVDRIYLEFVFRHKRIVKICIQRIHTSYEQQYPYSREVNTEIWKIFNELMLLGEEDLNQNLVEELIQLVEEKFCEDEQINSILIFLMKNSHLIDSEKLQQSITDCIFERVPQFLDNRGLVIQLLNWLKNIFDKEDKIDEIIEEVLENFTDDLEIIQMIEQFKTI